MFNSSHVDPWVARGVAFFGPRRSEDSLPAGGRVRRHRPGRRRRRTELYRGLARKGLTLHQLIVEYLQGHAHYRFTGSFEQIADELQLWFDQDGADRLVLSFNNGAAGVHGFIEHVVRLVPGSVATYRSAARGCAGNGIHLIRVPSVKLLPLL